MDRSLDTLFKDLMYNSFYIGANTGLLYVYNYPKQDIYYNAGRYVYITRNDELAKKISKQEYIEIYLTRLINND